MDLKSVPDGKKKQCFYHHEFFGEQKFGRIVKNQEQTIEW